MLPGVLLTTGKRIWPAALIASAAFCAMAPSAHAQGVTTIGVNGGGGVLSGNVIRLPITSVATIQICNNNLAGLVAVHVDALGSCRASVPG